MGVTSDGGGVSAVSLGAIAINTEYTLQIRVSGGVVFFSSDGGATEVQAIANIPASTVNMNAWFIRAYSQIGNVVGIDISHGMCEYGAASSGLY